MSTAEPHFAELRSRKEEDRLRWIAALTLGAVMVGHALLETAGDSLFLANVAVERLPYATIVVAVLAAGVAMRSTSRSNRSVLIGLQTLAAIGTISLWASLATSQAWTYYVLYIWSGIITGMIILRFWLLLGDLFTIREGKRIYATIAIGGSLGALLGSAIATYLAPRTGGAGLLIASAAAFALSTVGPLMSLGRAADTGRHEPAVSPEPPAAPSFVECLDSIRKSPYARRIAGLVMLGGIALTFGDYLFKSVLAEEITADQLATWLSRIYLGLNFLSIIMLTLCVTPLLRWLGVDRSLAVLPALIAVGGLGVLVGGALVASVFLKTADGTFRYSLHRTASELLYLPMSNRLRTLVKAAIDVVGLTAAKAFASIVILGLALSPDSRMLVAAAVVIAASTWFVYALRLRHSYLEVFRQTLSEGLIDTSIEHPELDLQSAGSLISALSDTDERRVIASMRILAERGHYSLIPTLILYHPAPRVVAHALDLFAETEREDLLELLSHLIDHEDACVRAATVRATWVLDPDLNHLQRFRDSECLAIQVSAMAGLLAVGAVDPDDYGATLDQAIDYPTHEPRLAAAVAARLRYHPVAREALLTIAQDEDAETAREAVRAIRASADEWFTKPLVGLLGNRRTRDGVRDALIDRGDEALDVLAEQLVDSETPFPTLRHIPRTIARFESRKAAKILIDSFSQVESGMVRFKLLRGLESLLLARGKERGAETKLDDSIDLQGIRDEFDRTLARAMELLHFEATLLKSQAANPEVETVGGELLGELLQDKRHLAMGRIFRLLGLIYRNEDFRAIQAGLESANGAERASAEELVETVLSLDAGRMVLGLATPGDVGTKLAAADSNGMGRVGDYTAVVRVLLKDGSRSLRAVALYYAGEIGIHCDQQDLSIAMPGDSADSIGEPRRLKDRALAILRELYEKAPAASPAPTT